MLIYFAGIERSHKRLKYLFNNQANHLMLTFTGRYRDIQFERFKQYQMNLLLDSGAFSVWKKGISIDIEEYCDFIVRYNIKDYIVLDVVGDIEKTNINYDFMSSKLGKKPIPVFHYGSDFKYLDNLVINQHNLICLGGTVGLNRQKKISFFNEVFARFPNQKFHGLGLTEIGIIQSFPFYSIDSTTWLIADKSYEILNNNGKREVRKDLSSEERFNINIQFFLRNVK